MIAKRKRIRAFCFSILMMSVSFSGIKAAPQEAKAAGLTVSAVSPEDVSIYLTMPEKGKELESLWKD